MAMTWVPPVPVRVHCGWLDGRPRSVALEQATLPVLAVVRVRRETAAYPRATGPRTLFEVVTPGARLALAYRHRDRRWLLEGMDRGQGELPRAA